MYQTAKGATLRASDGSPLTSGSAWVPVTGVCEAHNRKITFRRDHFDEGSYRDQIPSTSRRPEL